MQEFLAHLRSHIPGYVKASGTRDLLVMAADHLQEALDNHQADQQIITELRYRVAQLEQENRALRTAEARRAYLNGGEG